LGPSGLRTPPVTKTFPSGSRVALWSLRGPASDPVYLQVGVEAFKSITSAVAVGTALV
jgi:hypothetical protein